MSQKLDYFIEAGVWRANHFPHKIEFDVYLVILFRITPTDEATSANAVFGLS